MPSFIAFVAAGALATSLVAGPKPQAKPGPVTPKTLPSKPPDLAKPLPAKKKVLPKAKPTKCAAAPQLRVSAKAKVAPGMFRTIAAAADHARGKNYCRLRVKLSAGVHPDTSTVTIDRPTEIVGPQRGGAKIRTSFISRTGILLKVRNVTFDRPKAVALDIRHPKANTKLRKVAIMSAPGYGVTQHGGRFEAKGFVTSRTQTAEGALLSGAAVRLSGGVQAELEGWMAAFNGAHALVVYDRDTRVELQGVRISDTGHHPDAIAAVEAEREPGSFGAVVVQDHAMLLGKDVRVTRSDLVGVVATRGAKVRLTKFRSHAARSLPGTDGKPLGGDGVASRDDAIVQLQDFRVTKAARVGLELDRGYMRASQGRVTGCLIGVHADTTGLREDYSFLPCLEDEVLYLHNTVNLDATAPILPTPPGDTVPTHWCPELN